MIRAGLGQMRSRPPNPSPAPQSRALARILLHIWRRSGLGVGRDSVVLPPILALKPTTGVAGEFGRARPHQLASPGMISSATMAAGRMERHPHPSLELRASSARRASSRADLPSSKGTSRSRFRLYACSRSSTSTPRFPKTCRPTPVRIARAQGPGGARASTSAGETLVISAQRGAPGATIIARCRTCRPWRRTRRCSRWRSVVCRVAQGGACMSDIGPVLGSRVARSTLGQPWMRLPGLGDPQMGIGHMGPRGSARNELTEVVMKRLGIRAAGVAAEPHFERPSRRRAGVASVGLGPCHSVAPRQKRRQRNRFVCLTPGTVPGNFWAAHLRTSGLFSRSPQT